MEDTILKAINEHISVMERPKDWSDKSRKSGRHYGLIVVL